MPLTSVLNPGKPVDPKYVEMAREEAIRTKELEDAAKRWPDDAGASDDGSAGSGPEGQPEVVKPSGKV
jgi:hypothetical protein